MPAHDEPEYLDLCLGAISQSSFADYEVIVVDDGSTIPLREIVDKYGFKYVRLKVNQGPATARNVGASHARGEILFFIDSDVRVRSDTIEKVALAYNDPRINVYQGLASKTPLNNGFGPQLLALKWYFMLKDIREASFVYSHVFSIRKKIFDEVSGFNESFKPPGFGDEFEIGQRLRKKHVIHVDPNLLVEHRFQGIFARARSVYHRAYAWAKIYKRTKHFEKANASLQEATIGIIDLLMCLTTLFTLLNPWFSLVPLLLFSIQTALNGRFYSFLKSEKGIGFALRAIIPCMLWSIAQSIGGIHFLIKDILGIEQLASEGGFKAFSFRVSKYPSHIVFFITAKCNGRCRHCFYWQEISNAGEARVEHDQEITLDEIRIASKKMGHVEMLTITGGEPTLRDDLPEIIKVFYQNNRTRHVTIHTNGFLVKKLCRMLADIARACPRLEINVSLSIDGLKKVHDEIRGVNGAFDNAIQSLESIEKLKRKYPNINITINTVFNRLNQDNVVSLIDYLYTRHEIDGYYIALVRGTTRDSDIKDIDIEKYKLAVKHLERWKTRQGAYRNYALAGFRNAIDDLAPWDVIKSVLDGRIAYPCKAGQTVIVISERGEVYPCEMLGLSFGNLRDFDLNVSNVLTSSRARKILMAIKGASCSCTWECAIMNNLIFNWRAFPRILVRWLKNLKGWI
ncbi:MAG: glycosyltransferase [Candidatus Sigynarchaeota archaeon]